MVVGGVRLRWFPLRWHHLDVVPLPRHRQRLHWWLSRVLRSRCGHREPHLLDVGQRPHPQPRAQCCDCRRRCQWHAHALPTCGRWWLWLRLPIGHGHPRHVHQAAEGGERRPVEHGSHRAHPHESTIQGEGHRLLRVPRSGHCGRQDPGLLAHGCRDVHWHEPHPKPQSLPLRRPRSGPPQDDQAYRPGLGWRRLPDLHGQRVRPPGVDRFPAPRERLELPPLPTPMGLGRRRPPPIPLLPELRRAHERLREQVWFLGQRTSVCCPQRRG
mmetsp:Transcript_15557/g.33796  ORF Transcript_15557/g.33796 Transcript_15557/m.33796 type:complete len:270 (-) Transcript_15557:2855-3664(-)